MFWVRNPQMQQCTLNVHWVFNRLPQNPYTTYKALYKWVSAYLSNIARCPLPFTQKGTHTRLFSAYLIHQRRGLPSNFCIFPHFLPFACVFTNSHPPHHLITSIYPFVWISLPYGSIPDNPISKAGLLLLNTTDILVQMILWCGGLSRVPRHLPTRCQLYCLRRCDNQKCLQYCQMLSEGQNHSQVKITALE